MTGELDLTAVRAQSDEQALSALVLQYEPFILRNASQSCGRFVSNSDEEWSIALSAFAQAVRDYQPDKGGFLGFSQMVIRRRLCDYLRAQQKFGREISTDPMMFDAYCEEEPDSMAVQLAEVQKRDSREEESLRLEIEAANAVFSAYGFSFFDLAACSPKSRKTRQACAKAVAYLLQSPSLFAQMRDTARLPALFLEKNSKIPRKILERHRKYIIAAAEILSGEYPFLAQYLQGSRKEMGK
jgi:RNA polymerase sigma factor